ncbi:hypothetical protein CAPTEDRAFT_212527 [Capitella teleta]|uniref:Uncharacterized protein n=1 Tax=Capitella teleta TaxID=283909 RepID=R7TWR8_CAPTE|nr:hypothetical protein CAPTEDRAFT_212527 [Capitella teleta]|eukprot:ELT98057.1 hypothetical protein CAPTEDRAFT_212527 [Capitella teleta]
MPDKTSKKPPQLKDIHNLKAQQFKRISDWEATVEELEKLRLRDPGATTDVIVNPSDNTLEMIIIQTSEMKKPHQTSGFQMSSRQAPSHRVLSRQEKHKNAMCLTSRLADVIGDAGQDKYDRRAALNVKPNTQAVPSSSSAALNLKPNTQASSPQRSPLHFRDVSGAGLLNLCLPAVRRCRGRLRGACKSLNKKYGAPKAKAHALKQM